jgi:hypothetical protein
VGAAVFIVATKAAQEIHGFHTNRSHNGLHARRNGRSSRL